MKKTAKILRIISSALVLLVSFVFTVLEGTLLVTGDFLLYERPVIAFFQLLLRFLIPVLAFAVALFAIIKRERSFLPESLCLLASTMTMAFFISNNFGLYFLIIAALFAGANLFEWQARKE